MVNEILSNKYDLDISYYASDSRLTAEPDGKKYRIRDMIEKVKELGRPLTKDESEAYEIKN